MATSQLLPLPGTTTLLVAEQAARALEARATPAHYATNTAIARAARRARAEANRLAALEG